MAVDCYTVKVGALRFGTKMDFQLYGELLWITHGLILINLCKKLFVRAGFDYHETNSAEGARDLPKALEIFFCKRRKRARVKPIRKFIIIWTLFLKILRRMIILDLQY